MAHLLSTKPFPSHCVRGGGLSGAAAYLLKAAPPGLLGSSVCAIPNRYDQTHPKMLILTVFYKKINKNVVYRKKKLKKSYLHAKL